MLIPTEKLNLVKKILDSKEILENDALSSSILKNQPSKHDEESALSNDPWKDILGDEE